MKKHLIKAAAFIIAFLTVLNPCSAVAEEQLNTVKTPEPDNGFCYRISSWKRDFSPDNNEKILSFLRAGDFNRIYISLQEDEDNSPDLPRFSLSKEKNENYYDLLSEFAGYFYDNGIAVSLMLDPFSVFETDPIYEFVRNMAENDSSLAQNHGRQLRLNPYNERNIICARNRLQRMLACAPAIDEVVIESTSFAPEDLPSNGDPQIIQAQSMASFFEEISADGISVSISYDLSFSPYTKNLSFVTCPGLSPETLYENGLAAAVYPYLPFEGNVNRQYDFWSSLGENISVVPFLNCAQNMDTAQLFKASSKIYLMRRGGIDSLVVEGDLEAVDDGNAMFFSPLLTGGLSLLPQGYSLDYPHTLSISRPAGEIEILGSSYYVMGSSDPDVPLYMNGELVERLTSGGSFGVFLSDIPYGTNTYTFSQGSKSETVTIVRPEPRQAEVVPISSIVESSIYPSNNEAVNANEDITFRCIAPANSNVSVTFNGQTVSLSQVAIAETGTPATFTGQMPMPNMDDEKTVNCGKATYTLLYQGRTTSYQSSGDLYSVGENTTLAVVANDYINNVYSEMGDEGNFFMTLYNGACDYVEEITDNYYKLKSGGYLPKSTADILEGSPTVQNQVSSAKYTAEERGEYLTLSGNALPPYRAQFNGENLVVTLWNCDGIPQNVDISSSSILDGISTHKNNDGSTELVFDFKDGCRPWGYNVEYDEYDTVIYLKKPPTISVTADRPLQGVVVVIDVGHGGGDPGALGIAGTDGPAENDLNFIDAYATKEILQALGADVHMVNEENEWLSFEDRMDPARQLRADFFLSFHHNSTAESVDSGKYSGTEIYYHEDLSQTFAENVLGCLTAATGHNPRGAYQDYYRVTRMTYAPSLLMELGFVVNPVEYESLCQPVCVYQTAIAVAEAIIKTIRPFQ